MSEFSDSYHLRTEKIEDAIDLFRRSGLGGYVYPTSNGWVTLLPEGPMFEPNEELIAANRGILVHYVHGEDYGWGIELYEGSSLITQHQTHWEPDLSTSYILDLSALDSAIGTNLSAIDKSKMRGVLNPASVDEVFANRPAQFIAEAIGLTNFNWVAFDYLAGDEEQGRRLPAGVIRVENGNI